MRKKESPIPTPNPKASPLSPLQGARGTSGVGTVTFPSPFIFFFTTLTPPLTPPLQGRGGIVYGFVQNTIPLANDSPPLKGRGRGGDCDLSISLYLLLYITDPTPGPKASPLSPLQGARGTSGAGRHRVRLR